MSHPADSTADPRTLARMPWVMGITLAALGTTGPFLALELRRMGVEGWALTAAMVSLPVSRLIIGPLWGAYADHTQDDARVLKVAAAVGLIGTLGLALGGGPWAALWVLVWIGGRGGMGPVMEGMLLKALGADVGRYGRVRAWGSVGFALAVLGASLLREHLGVSPLWTGVVASVLGLLLILPLPPAAPTPRVAVGPALRALGRDPGVRWILLGAALHYAPHSIYDTYFTVFGEDLGLPAGQVGLAVAAGVVVEIGVMALSEPLLRRFGALGLVRFAALLMLPRWVVTALAPAPWVLMVQTVHGLSFGLFWVAAVHLLAARVPRGIASSSQGLLGAAVGGVGAILGTLGGGVLLDQLGSRALFWGAAAVALITVWVWWRAGRVLQGPAGHAGA